MYEQIARNKWRSILLVFLVLLLAAGLGYVFGILYDAGPFGIVVALLADWMLRAFFWGGYRGRRGGRDGAGNVGAIIAIVGLVLAALAPLFAQLIRFAVSRRRELLADADGALLSRYPPGLASALRKIAASTEPLRASNNATAHLWFSQPSRTPGSGWTRWERLFSTHPPIEERIKAL